MSTVFRGLKSPTVSSTNPANENRSGRCLGTQLGKLRARDWAIAIVGAGVVLAIMEGDAMDWPLYIAMLALLASCWALYAVLRGMND